MSAPPSQEIPEALVAGSFRSVFLYDLSEEIRLDTLAGLLQQPPAARSPATRHLAPEYVRFERPPVVEALPPQTLGNGDRLDCQVNYYDYGVVSIEFERAFAGHWQTLPALAAEWVTAPDLERLAARLASELGQRIQAALVKPYDYRLSEDYYIFQIRPIPGTQGAALTAAELTSTYGGDIARIVRGEAVPLSREEQAEVLQARLSYYPNDLLVVGWNAALIYDTDEGAAATIQLLKYANSQLLEFRHYDHVLSALLDQVYDFLSSGSGFLSRWRKVREAERLSAMRLDVRELTERVDNSIKFLSDTFSARIYRLAAARIGVPDYRRLVDEKLKTTGELYQFMMDRFHHGRAFVLELMVVIILIIELVYLFRGKS